MIYALPLLLLLSQSNDALLFARARAHTENGEFQKATELWEEMARRHPDRVDPLLYLSLSFRRGESFDAAEDAVARALEIDPKDGRALWQLGLLRNLQQRPAEALEAFDALQSDATQLVQKKAARQATFHYQRGVALQAVGRYVDATQAMRDAVDRDPEFFAAAYSLYLLLRTEDPAAAHGQLRFVEELRDRQPDWIRNDQLRLEAGRLSDIEWPEAYERLRPKGEGKLVSLQLDGVRSRADGVGAIVEIWTSAYTLRRRYVAAPMRFRVGDAKRIEVLRIIWPNGMVQNALAIDLAEHPDGVIAIREELFIKGSWGGVKIQD